MRPTLFAALLLATTTSGVAAQDAPSAASSANANAGGGEILWDSYGVPHVYANTEAGAFWGFGYAQAQNHGDLLLRMMGEARGRAAEYWGAKYEDADRWLVANDVPQRSAAWFAMQTPQMQADLQAFADGINAYAAAHPDKLDPAMRVVLPLSGTDIMAHAHKLMNYVYVASDRKVLADPRTNEAGGSNAWAVAPSRSESGNAMLLANPHLPWAPSQLTYMEAHLNAPGYSVYGATQVGLPVLRFAFNDDLGFTNTVNTMLGFTSYQLELTDRGYRYDGVDLPFRTELKSYKVKGDDGVVRPVHFEQRYAIQGPVFDLPNNAGTVALQVAGLDRAGALQQYLDMGKAHDFAGFTTALEQMQVPMFNIVYADRAGHIMYFDNGLLPKHDSGDLGTWSRPVAGNTSSTLWHDVHSYADLPKVIDPASGFVQNANDPPWLATWPRQLDPAAFPGYVAPTGPFSLRAQHSIELMDQTPKLSFDTFVERKLETRALMAERVLPDLLAATAGSNDPDIVEATALLSAWDARFEPDATGALLFETWAALFAPANFTDQSNYAVKWTMDDPLDTPRGLKDPAAAVAMLKSAVGRTRELYGRIDRPFGEVSRFHIGDVSVPGNGGFGNTGVFRTITWGPMKDGERTPVHGETWVSMVEFGTPMKAVGLMSYGNASQPDSPHRGDQLEMLSRKKFRTLWTTREEVERNLEERTRF